MPLPCFALALVDAFGNRCPWGEVLDSGNRSIAAAPPALRVLGDAARRVGIAEARWDVTNEGELRVADSIILSGRIAPRSFAGRGAGSHVEHGDSDPTNQPSSSQMRENICERVHLEVSLYAVSV